MTTAADVITRAMRLFNILDITETPTSTDLAALVPVLNDLLRSEHADGAAQFLITLVTATLPVGVNGQVYQFVIGTAQSSYLVQQDAVGLRQLWMNDINLTVNRETRGPVPKVDCVRTTYPGIVTRWHPERQIDGSVLVTAWQPPRAPATALLEIGLRIPALTKADGTDTIPLPPEGIHDACLLLGRRIYKNYGVTPKPTDVIFADAERVNMRWRDWAHGQQWLRMLRA